MSMNQVTMRNFEINKEGRRESKGAQRADLRLWRFHGVLTNILKSNLERQLGTVEAEL